VGLGIGEWGSEVVTGMVNSVGADPGMRRPSKSFLVAVCLCVEWPRCQSRGLRAASEDVLRCYQPLPTVYI
jgi:hypothetical protein